MSTVKEPAMPIYYQILAAGVKIEHHESDLYVPVNDVTMAIVDQWKFKESTKQFKNAIEETTIRVVLAIYL